MKILFVTDLCPIQENEKGLPLTLLNFILDFKSLGADVTLLRPNIIPNVLIRKRKILPDGEYLYNGIRIINKNFLTPFFNENQFLFLKNLNFDIIVSHMPSGILAANKISKLLKIPYITSVHSSDIKVLSDIKYLFLKKQMEKAYLEASLVLPRSLWLKNRIQEIIPKLTIKDTVPSGIDSNIVISQTEIDNKVEKFYGNPYKIFSAGTLIKRKNFEELIKTVAKLDNATLEIGGEGKERKNLERLIKKLNAQDKIKLLGQKTQEEIYKSMKNSSVFVLASKNETFGMVYLEAMSNGCIVLCPENSGMAGYIKDGFNGFLFQEGSLYDKIKHLKELENAKEIINNACETAKSMDRLKMAQNYLNLIQNILV